MRRLCPHQPAGIPGSVTVCWLVCALVVQSCRSLAAARSHRRPTILSARRGGPAPPSWTAWPWSWLGSAFALAPKLQSSKMTNEFEVSAKVQPSRWRDQIDAVKSDGKTIFGTIEVRWQPSKQSKPSTRDACQTTTGGYCNSRKEEPFR